MANKDYILGVNEYELKRLGFQHGVWKEITDAFLDKIGIRQGWKVLDAGSGPGFVTAELLNKVGTYGEVTALEPSEMYLDHFRNMCKKQGSKNTKFVLGKVEDAVLPENYYDLIYARWVIGFVPDPEQFISKLKKALAPGGIMAFQDYAFHGLFLYPRGGAYENLSPAVEAYWKYTGGDLAIAARIPFIFKKLGIELLDYQPTSLAGGPECGVFQWHHSFITHHVPLMVEKGIISETTGAAILKDWNEHMKNPDSIFFSPIVVNVSGRKEAS
jgi:ubiquinone/menaquinone biosynthesis C-methylase UbiE